MQERKAPSTLWGYQIKNIRDVDGYVLVDMNTVPTGREDMFTQTIDMLHMTYGTSYQTLPVAFMSEANAMIYAKAMAVEKNDDTLLQFMPLSTRVVWNGPEKQVYLMQLTTADCKKCGEPISQMIDFRHGLLFQTVTLKCPHCGHEQKLRQLKPPQQ